MVIHTQPISTFDYDASFDEDHSIQHHQKAALAQGGFKSDSNPQSAPATQGNEPKLLIERCSSPVKTRFTERLD